MLFKRARLELHPLVCWCPFWTIAWIVVTTGTCSRLCSASAALVFGQSGSQCATRRRVGLRSRAPTSGGSLQLRTLTESSLAAAASSADAFFVSALLGASDVPHAARHRNSLRSSGVPVPVFVEVLWRPCNKTFMIRVTVLGFLPIVAK